MALAELMLLLGMEEPKPKHFLDYICCFDRVLGGFFSAAVVPAKLLKGTGKAYKLLLLSLFRGDYKPIIPKPAAP